MTDSGEEVEQVIVLVGTPRNMLTTMWHEHKGSLEEVRDARLVRAQESTVAQIGEEIIEVVVRRRIRLTGEVQATDVTHSGSSNPTQDPA